MFNLNPLFYTDFYKVGHISQYPEGTQYIYSNLTARSNKLAPGGIDKIVFAGLQGFIKSFLEEQFNEYFFKQPKEKVLAEYQELVDTALGPNLVAVEHIAKLHDLQYLPISIKALPEGSIVGMKVPVLTITNTHPDFFWLTNYLETALSSELWKIITSSTIAFEYRKILEKAAKKTGSPLGFVQWQGHDFSLRGMGLVEGAKSGAGHLFSFLGTDTIPAIKYLQKYYNAGAFVGGSVPATEHSVMCAGGKEEEQETIRRIIQEVVPSGVVSVVSDTWDFFKVLTQTAPALKEVILNRKPNALGLAKVVFRPDSGDPVEILCGTKIVEIPDEIEYADFYAEDYLVTKATEENEPGEDGVDRASALFNYKGKTYRAEVEIDWNKFDEGLFHRTIVTSKSFGLTSLTPEEKGAVECLWDTFGGTITDTGHKLLNERVGLIYGDSITLERAKTILERLEAKGFASANVVFGIGSFTYQYNTRDTFGMAVKATHAVVNSKARDLFKDPVTDSGLKKSAKGLLRVEKDGENFAVFQQQTTAQEKQGELQEVFRDSKLLIETSLEEIRAKLNEAINRVT